MARTLQKIGAVVLAALLFIALVVCLWSWYIVPSGAAPVAPSPVPMLPLPYHPPTAAPALSQM